MPSAALAPLRGSTSGSVSGSVSSLGAVPVPDSPLPQALRAFAARTAGVGPVALSSIPSVFRAGELPANIAPGIPTGFPDLDAEIPGGGWPVAALTEILSDACGIGEVSLLLPALRHLTRSADWRGRGLLLIDPPHMPYAPALAAAGIDLAALAILRPRSEDDALWAAEQALRSGAAGAVLLWARPARGSDSAQRYQRLRRLQLAAAAGGGLGIVFSASCAATLSTPAALRLALSVTAEGALAVSLCKRRGLARPKTVTLRARRLPQPYLAGQALRPRALAAGQMAGGAVPVDPSGAGLPGRIAHSVAAVGAALRAASVRLTREREFTPSR